METEQLVSLCKEALRKAHGILISLGNSGVEEVHDAHVVDISTEADMAVSHALKDFFRQQKIPAILLDEESGKTELMPNPIYTISFDDIDGTFNYHRGAGLLPYCTLVCIFDSAQPKFKDALVAGVIEHNSGKVWIAIRGKGCFVDSITARTSGKKELDEKTFVIIDRKTITPDIAGYIRLCDKCWVRDFGSAALHLAGVSSGLFDAYINAVHKGHELGAGYLLIKEAGGSMTDWKGNPFDNVAYDFNAKYPVIAASTKELSNALRSFYLH